MNTRFLKQIGQLLQRNSLQGTEMMDGSLSASSLGKTDGSIILSDQHQIIVIEKLVINVNYAQGGGATVNVRNWPR